MISDKIYLDIACLGKTLELVGVSPDFYADGARQPEPVGYKYDVLLRDHKSDKITVKIPGAKQMDEPLSGFGTPVVFEALKVRPYVNRVTGTMAFSASAERIKPIKADAAKG